MAKKIKGITIEIGGNVQPLKKALSEVDKTSRDLQSELRQIDRLLKFDPKNTELLGQKQKILNDYIGTTKERLDTLKEAQRQVGEQFKRGEVGEEQYRAIKREVQATEGYLKHLETQLKKTNDRWKDTQAALKKFGDKSKEVGESWTKNVTVPIMAVGTAAVLAADSYKKGTDIIRKATGLTGEKAEELDAIYENILKTVPNAGEEVAKTLTALYVATGETGKGLESLARYTLDFARIAETDAGESAKTLGRLMNALGQDASGLPSTMDKLTKAAQLSGIGVNELANYIIDAGPAFEEMGFDLNRSIGLFAEFQKSGANPREVLSSLNIVLNKMAKDGATNAEEAFSTLLGQIKDAPDILSATTIASEAFGARVGSKVAEDIRAGKFEVEEWVKALEDSEGAVEKTASELGTFGDGLATMKNKAAVAFEPLGKTIIETLLPILERLFDWVEKITDWFDGLSDSQKKWIVVIGGVAAAIGPLLVLLGGIATAVSAISWPVLAVVGAIAAVIAITAVVIKYWDEIKGFFVRLWESIKDIFSRAWEFLKNLFLDYHPVGLVIKHWDTITGFFSKLWDKVKDIFKKAWDGIKNVATGAWDGVLSFFKTGKDKIVGIFEGIKKGILGVWDKIVGGIKGFVNLIISAMNTMIRGLNKISFSIPKWVAKLLGLGSDAKFGFNIREIPKLHTGTDYFQPPAGMLEGLALLRRGEKVVPPGKTSAERMVHSGTIRVEGVNDQGQLVAAAEIIMDGLKDPRARLAVDRAMAKSSTSKLRPLGVVT